MIGAINISFYGFICIIYLCIFLSDAPTDLISHCYRAALQEIILAHDPHAPLGSIKLTMRKAHQKPFAE